MKLPDCLMKEYERRESKDVSWSWAISEDPESSSYLYKALCLRWDGFILPSCNIFPICHKSGPATQTAIWFCSELSLHLLIITLMSLELLNVNKVDSRVEGFPPCPRLFSLFTFNEQFDLSKIVPPFNRQISFLCKNPTEISETTLASICLPVWVKSGKKRHETSTCSWRGSYYWLVFHLSWWKD